MKKLLLILVMVSASVFARTYQEVKQSFKTELYYRQVGLMEQAEYFDFIEKYMLEGEKNLRVIGFCMENPDSDLSKEYLAALIGYNVACFHHYIKSDESSQVRFNSYIQRLKDILIKIKGTRELSDLNIAVELKKTEELFSRANAQFYKKLSIRIKFLLLFA